MPQSWTMGLVVFVGILAAPTAKAEPQRNTFDTGARRQSGERTGRHTAREAELQATWIVSGLGITLSVDQHETLRALLSGCGGK